MRSIGKAIMMVAVVIGICSITVTTVQASSGTTTQSGKLVARPLTPQNMAVAGVTNEFFAGYTNIVQKSGGLLTTGKGQPVYLEAQVLFLSQTTTLTNGNIISSGGAGPFTTNVLTLTNSLFGIPTNTFVDVYADRKITTTYTNITGGTVTSLVNVSAYAYYWPQSVTDVAWSFGAPAGSTVTFGGPLFTNAPMTNTSVTEIFNVGERNTSFVPTNLVVGTTYLQARQMIIPDVEGLYYVTNKITNGTKVYTNVIQVICGTYKGDGECGYCHSGGAYTPVGMPYIPSGAPVNDNYSGWAMTAHAIAMQMKIDGSTNFTGELTGTGFKESCYSCHVLGSDSNSLAINDGFDDIKLITGWVAPSSSTNGNWAAMPLALKHKANIQCENCHGAASVHTGSAPTWETKTNSISVNLGAGVCGSCHDSVGAKRTHVVNAQWRNSPHGSGRYVSRYSVNTNNSAGVYTPGVYFPGVGCDAPCHSAKSFIEKYDTSKFFKQWGEGKSEGITCVACHDPHKSGPDANEAMLRTLDDVPVGYTNMFQVGSQAGAVYNMTEAEAGLGILCMNCHRVQNIGENYVTNRPSSSTTSYGPSIAMAIGTADMIAGVNGIEYGGFTNFAISVPMHLYMVGDTCVSCHMDPDNSLKYSTNPSYSNSYLYAKGHTMQMTTTNDVDVVELCQGCHGKDMEEFDFVSSINVFKDKNHDYDGDGITNGVQTEVRGLLNKVAMKLGAASNCNPTITSASSLAQRRAAYNHSFVRFDGSYGVHNSKYAVALLKASLADLDRAALYSPSTNVYNGFPMFTWPTNDAVIVAGIKKYTLNIKLNGLAYRTVAVSGTNVYQIPATAPLPGGIYEWTVNSSQPVSFQRITVVPAAITLLSPTNGMSAATTASRTFIWRADTNGQATSYNMKLFNGPKTTLYTRVTAALNLTNVIKTVTPGTNSWQIQGVGTDGSGAWSTVRSFIVPSTPGRIVTLAPTNNSTKVAAALNFTWQTDTNMLAANYLLRIALPAGAPGFGKTNLTTITGVTRTNALKNISTLVPVGTSTVQWWIQGKSASGKLGPMSVTNDLNVTK